MMPSTEEDPTTGLVLGGGGAKGFSQLGVLKALQQQDIGIDLIVGTSMGSVIGSSLAIKTDIDRLIKVLSALDINKLLNFSPNGRREIEKLIGQSVAEQFRPAYWMSNEDDGPPVKLSKMFQFFRLFTRGYSIEDLDVPYAAVATELNEGSRVVITEGELYKAVTASSAIPGFVPPVKWRGKLLIDGGVVDKLPINVAINLGADQVLAVDVSGGLGGTPSDSIEVALRSETITSSELVRIKTNIARDRLEGDLLTIKPDVSPITWLDFNQVEQAVEIGQNCAQNNMESIRKSML